MLLDSEAKISLKDERSLTARDLAEEKSEVLNFHL